MSSSSLTLDRERLLAPIAGEQPAGESLRYEGTFDAIQEARREDDPTLPQGVWKTDLKVADWQAVRDLSSAALAERTKDLQIAAWLTESLLGLDGIAGLSAGIGLVADVCERFWAELHPAIEDDDAEARLAVIEWIDDKLSQRLKAVRISAPEGHDDAPYRYLDWEAMGFGERLQKTGKSTGPDTSRPTRESLVASWTRTPASFFRATLGDLHGLDLEVGRLEAVLEKHLGDQAPRLRRLRDVAARVEQLLRRNGPAGLDAEAVEEDEPAEEARPEWPQGTEGVDPEARSGRQQARAPGPGSVRTRAEAYRQLAEIADFLLATEPHSPAGYLIRRAVSWGNLSLVELLEEIVRDQGDLQSIYTLLGIRDTK